MSKMGDLRSSANRASSHTGQGHKISLAILDRGRSGAILFRVKGSLGCVCVCISSVLPFNSHIFILIKKNKVFVINCSECINLSTYVITQILITFCTPTTSRIIKSCKTARGTFRVCCPFNLRLKGSYDR